jgi:drug/metabolite transporter (DMT)-like permease
MTPLARGFVWAVLAAVSFGVTTPLVSTLGRGLGTWSTAALLYLGSAVFAAVASRRPRTALRELATHRRLLLAIGIVGGMLAPAVFVFGLHRTSAVSASLALNMEAPFSVALAALAFHEYVGRRIVVAMLAIVGGAVLLVLPGAGLTGGLGIFFVIVATALWAIDNALSSRLADVDPQIVVFWKSAIGAAASFSIAVLLHQSPPAMTAAVALACVGALGYGASLFFYLVAQRAFGVARTASVFAFAPFIGALVAVAMRDRIPDTATYAAFALMAAGIILHATERHSHAHTHHALGHAHLHRHDDGHHTHAHDRDVAGEHSHAHSHPAVTHTHEHAPDAHHTHTHAETS